MFDQYLQKVLAKLLYMRDMAAETTPNLIIAILFLVVVFFISKVVRNSLQSLLVRSHAYTNLAKVLSRVAASVLNLLGVLVAAGIVFPSVTPASLFSLLGISGVAIGFAFKDVFQNFLAGILILLLRSFQIGDQIEVDGVEGTVEDIEIRATIIRTFDNRKIVIPNSSLFTNKVVVDTAYDKRRISLFTTLLPTDDIAQKKKEILNALNGVDGILRDPAAHVLVIGFGAPTIELEVRFWVHPVDRSGVMRLRDAALVVLKPVLTDARLVAVTPNVP